MKLQWIHSKPVASYFGSPVGSEMTKPLASIIESVGLHASDTEPVALG